MKNLLNKSDKIVIKIGSKAITTNDSINRLAIENLARASYELLALNKKVSIITSGAIASGRRAINDWTSSSLPEKQMLAAIGQPILMQEYISTFRKYGLNVAQLLIGKIDFESRFAFQNLKDSYNTCLERKIIPIINENDPVATHEIKFSDNDELQALVVRDLEADLAINLITYNGLIRNGRLIKIGDSFHAIDYDNLSKEVKEGRGGLQGKLTAMETICISGKNVIIGNAQSDILEMIKGSVDQTRFYPTF